MGKAQARGQYGTEQEEFWAGEFGDAYIGRNDRPENYNRRSQSFAPTFHDCGQFYWMKSQSLMQREGLFAEKTVGLEIPESEVQDIDNEEDWRIAEAKFALMRGGNHDRT